MTHRRFLPCVLMTLSVLFRAGAPAILLAVVFPGERLADFHAAGMVLIFTGIAMTTIAQTGRSRSSAALHRAS